MTPLPDLDQYLAAQGFPPGPIVKASGPPRAADIERAGAFVQHLLGYCAALRRRLAENEACISQIRLADLEMRLPAYVR